MADAQKRKRPRNTRKPLLDVSGNSAISADEITRYIEAIYYGEEDPCLLIFFFRGYSSTILLPWNVLFRLWLVRLDATKRKTDNDDCSSFFASGSILPKVLVSLKADALLFRHLMPVNRIHDNDTTVDLLDVDSGTDSKAMIRKSCWSRDCMLLFWETHQRRHIIRNLKDHGARAELQHSEQLCLLAVIRTIDEICSVIKAVDHSLLIEPKSRDVPIQSIQSNRDGQQGERDDQVAANQQKEKERIELFHRLNVEAKIIVDGDKNSLRLANFLDSLVIYCQRYSSGMGDELEIMLVGLCQRTWNEGEIWRKWVSSVFRHFCSQDTPEASLTLKEFHIYMVRRMIYNQSERKTCLVDAIVEEFYDAVSHDSSDIEVDRKRIVSDFVIRMSPVSSLFLQPGQIEEPLSKALKVFTDLNRDSEVLLHLFVAYTLRLVSLSKLAQGEVELTAANVLARSIFLARAGLLSVTRSCRPSCLMAWCRQVYDELERTISSTGVIVLWREMTLDLIHCYKRQTILMEISADSPASHFVSRLPVLPDELISTGAPRIERKKLGSTIDGQENVGTALVCSSQQLLDQIDIPSLPSTGLAYQQRDATCASMDTAVLVARRRRQAGVPLSKSSLSVSLLPTTISTRPARAMILSDDDFLNDGGGGVNKSVHSEEDTIDAESDDEILLLDL